MGLLEFIGISEPALGALFILAWIGVLVATLSRYDRGIIPRSELYLWTAGSLWWIAFSLGLIRGALAGTARLALDVVFFMLGIGGIVLFVGWWWARADERRVRAEEV